VISFFLIVYYNSSDTTFSGLFTMIINRVGDALLVISVAFFIYFSSSGTYVLVSNVGVFPLVGFVLLVALCTKSAIYPFSS
jgi:NADH:ubiquinone oxidoreductase subunit 5 (subunit L)/multisubunit Na+/H+ antiporter MnhA subunit